jgi:hypothetical protein
MMEAQEKTRVQIGLVQPDDDMRQEFQGAIQKQEQSRIDLQFEQMLRPPEPKIDGVTGPTPKPAEGNQPAEVTIQPRSVGQMAGAAVSDVAGGAIEAPVQVVGGVMDALNEVSDALESVLPLGEMLGGIEIMDPETGEFTLRALSGEEMKAREDQVFEALAPAEAETVTGNFVRSASQFLTGFIPAMKGAKALGASGGIATQLGAGAVADAVVFDPHEDRLSTFLNEVPALAPIVPDYLAETDPAKVSELQGRLANAIEGAGLGVATEGLMKAFKYYRAARQAKLQNKPEATAEEAARDAIREAAREELNEPIDDAALRGLGDPDDAPIVVAREDDTLDTALARLQETKARIEKADASDKVLSGIANLLDGLEAARKGTPAEGRTAMDDLLDQVRAGVNVNLPKRPVATFLKDKGGIDPASEIAANMRSRGITAKTHPGLFRKGGLRSLDNIPANEVDLMDGRDVTDPATGYVTEQGWLDGLESELRGDPWYDAKTQAMVDEQIAPVEEMSAMLDELGINPREMGNEEIAARLDEIASENARLRALDEVPHPADQDLPEGYDPDIEGDYPFSPTANDMRNLGDQVAESDAAQGALARPASKPKPKVFLNMARIKSREDVKEALQLFADADAEAINAKRRGKVSNAQTAREAQKEFTELTDLIGRKPGPMSAAEAVAARRMLTASGEQTVALARKAADPGATSADLYNFRRAMLVHYAIQSEVIAARTETARALQSWSIASRATKGAQGVVCVL